MSTVAVTLGQARAAIAKARTFIVLYKTTGSESFRVIARSHLAEAGVYVALAQLEQAHA